MTDSVNKGMEVDVIYLDFSKAFVTVSQSTFSAYLRRYGLRDGKLAELPASKSSMSKGQSATSDVSKVLILVLVLVLLKICINKQGTINLCLLPTHY